MKKRITNTVVLLFLVHVMLCGQNFQDALKDSTQNEYKYKLPFWGKEVYEKGFELPLPIGVMMNYYSSDQNLNLTNTRIGYKGNGMDIPLVDLTNLVQYESVKTSATSVNVRADVWILPFLNVYGVFGRSHARTEVNLSYPIHLTAVANQVGGSAGFGATGAAGYRNYFMVVDANMVWTTMNGVDAPVRSTTMSTRIGRTFKLKNPERTVSFWVGAMDLNMGKETSGTIGLSDIIPNTAQTRDQIVTDYWAWYNSLGKLDPKRVIANQILTPIVNDLANTNSSGDIKYDINKEAVQKWNFMIGGEFQLNPHWQARAEWGLIGNRKSTLISANYRFGW